MAVQVKVYSGGEERTIDLCDTEEQFKRITVLQLKKKIVSVFGLPDNVKLVFGTQHLDEDTLLCSYNIRHLACIYVVERLPGGGGPGMGDGGMGDREGRNQSMEQLKYF